MKLSSRQQRLKFMQRQFEVELARDMAALEKQIIKELARTYNDNMKVTKGLLADLYEKYAKDGMLSRDELMKYNRLLGLEKELAKHIKSLTGETRKLTRKGIVESIQGSYLRGRYAMESGLSVNTGLYGVNERLIEANLLNPFDRIGWQSRIQFNLNNTFRGLVDAINEGSIQGYAYDKTAALMTHRIDRSFNDAVRIVRSEQHRASQAAANTAHQESARAAERLGIEVRKVWNHYAVGDFRDSHADQLDGQVADDDGLFHLEGLSAEYPGGFGVAEEDINCKCTISTEIVEDEEDRLSGMDEVPSYADWQEDNRQKILRGE